MSTALMNPTVTLLTAEEFTVQYPNHTVELIDGIVEELPMPHQLRGKICYRIIMAIGRFIEENDLGHVTTNDSYVVTSRNPDRVRGGDICYFSYERLPKGPIPSGLLAIVPDLVVEVRSPSNRWVDVISKMMEYLRAGVRIAILADIETQSVTVYRSEEFPQVFDNGDTFVLPDLFPGFSVAVRSFFE